MFPPKLCVKFYVIETSRYILSSCRKTRHSSRQEHNINKRSYAVSRLFLFGWIWSQTTLVSPKQRPIVTSDLTIQLTQF